MKRSLLAALGAALLPLVVASCADSGPACTVEDGGDGTRTVTCVDGTSVTLPSGEGTCTLGVGEDGGKVIVCSDGTTVKIGPDGLPVFPGGGLVVGTVRLYGRDRHDGVTVRSRWTDERAVSDADGAFSLEVRAGNHDLVFEHPDFEPLVVPAVPAVGPYQLPTTILHPSRRLAGDGASYWPSPDETAIAVHTGGARLAIRRVADGAEVSLSEAASFPPVWDGDGGALAFLERQDSWTGEATLVRYDLATGTRAELSTSATRVFSWPGGGLLYLEFGAGLPDRLFRWTAAEGPVPFGTAQRWVEPRFTDDGGAVFVDDGTGQVAWREADGRGGVLGAPSTWALLPAPHGPFVAYQDFQGSLRFLDRRDGSSADLGTFVSPLEFSPDGAQLLFLRDGAAVVRRLDTGAERTVARGPSWTRFVADGGVLVVEEPTVTLHRPDGRVDELTGDVSPGNALLSPDRIRLVLRRASTNEWELHLAVGADVPLPLGPAPWLMWTADSLHLLAGGDDGGFRKIDALDGDAAPFAPTGNELVPSPDGSRVLWVGFGAERPFLVVHELATGREVRLAEGSFDAYGFSTDGGAVGFRTCGTFSCDLWYWAGADAPVPVHDAVSFFSLGRRLLFYRFGPPTDHPEAARSGLWYARLPGD